MTRRTFEWECRRYSEFYDQVPAMDKALDKPLFTTTLKLPNTAGKYCANLPARYSAAPQTDTAKPVV